MTIELFFIWSFYYGYKFLTKAECNNGSVILYDTDIKDGYIMCLAPWIHILTLCTWTDVQ